jgi:hypothetical protein
MHSFHGPLGETLVWTTALAELLGVKQEPAYSGLAYARNCVLHGAAVVTQVVLQGPYQQSPLLGDAPRFTGSATAHVWGFTDDPEPYDPASDSPERNAKRRADYNDHVAQHAVFPMLDKALLDLGVNIWAMGQDLEPRRNHRPDRVPTSDSPNTPALGGRDA